MSHLVFHWHCIAKHHNGKWLDQTETGFRDTQEAHMQFRISFALSSAGVVGKKWKWRSCIIRGPNSSLVEPESGHCLRGGPSPTLWRRAFESLTWQNAVWVTESPGTSGNGRRGPWRWGGVMRVCCVQPLSGIRAITAMLKRGPSPVMTDQSSSNNAM